VSVADTGIGISAEFLPHVFDRFSQQDSSANRKFGGLGLGLAISRQLVELHGGSMSVKSLGEGQGATFVVNLPLTLLESKSERAGIHPTHDGNESTTAMPELNGMKILVVDDEADALDLMRRVLEAQGARVIAAESADSAFRELKLFQPDVIVSDIGMPGMDGFQFMRQLRAGEPKGQRVPALALTAFARAEDRKRSILAAPSKTRLW
jgi:CheY-like chemotaxis protein